MRTTPLLLTSRIVFDFSPPSPLSSSIYACFPSASRKQTMLSRSPLHAASTHQTTRAAVCRGVHSVRHRSRGVSSGHISARFRVMSACSLDARSLNIRDRAARCAVDEPAWRCRAANFSAAGPNFSRVEPGRSKSTPLLYRPQPFLPAALSKLVPAFSGRRCFASGVRRPWTPSMRRMNPGRKPWL
ncbi:hypothetical protein MRX96_052869 [Rhipicephalus microplus]